MRDSFKRLYTTLAAMLKEAVDGEDSGTACLVMWCWGLDFNSPDHRELLVSGVTHCLVRKGQGRVERASDV